MLIWNFNFQWGRGRRYYCFLEREREREREREFNALEAMALTPTSASATFTLFPIHTLFWFVAFSKVCVFLVILKWVFVFLLRNEVWISFIYCFSTIFGLFFNFLYGISFKYGSLNVYALSFQFTMCYNNSTVW